MDNAYHQIAMCCMNKYVGITTSDGQSHDGFIAHVDQDYITLAIPHIRNGRNGHRCVYVQTIRAIRIPSGFFPAPSFYS